MDNTERQPNYLLIVCIVIQLLVFAVIGTIVANLFTSDNVTFNPTAKPIAHVLGLPSSFTNERLFTISSTIYPLMLQNSEKKTLSNDDIDVRVKDNSETSYHFEDKGFILYSAIIEAANLDQSYRLFYGYSDDSNQSFQEFIDFICIKAPVASCNSTDTSEYNIAQEFLPLYHFDQFTVSFEQNSLKKINITPIYDIDDEDTKASCITEVKTALQSLGLSPELYDYHVSTADEFTYEI